MKRADRKNIVDQVKERLDLKSASESDEALLSDGQGRIYYVKYRTEIESGTLAFGFSDPELAKSFDFFLGAFVSGDGFVYELLSVRKSDLRELLNKTEDSWRLRWNETNRDDARIELQKF